MQPERRFYSDGTMLPATRVARFDVEGVLAFCGCERCNLCGFVSPEPHPAVADRLAAAAAGKLSSDRPRLLFSLNTPDGE